jgi:exonuclease SbcC
VHLERSDAGGWTSLSHSKEEVGTLVTDLVGLSRDQFRQVVLLPQGEFATFLRADDDRRREVLMRLFGAQFYRRVTDQLQACAQAARSALAQADTDLAARVSAAWEAAGRAPDEALAATEATIDQRVAQVDALAEEVEDAAAGSAAAAEHNDEQVVVAQAQQATAIDLLHRVERRAALLSSLERCEAGRAEHEVRVRRLARARAAAPVGPLLVLLEEADSELVSARAGLGALPRSTDLPDEAPPEALEVAADQWRAVAASLGHAALREEGLAQLRCDLRAATQGIELLTGERDRADDLARQLPGESLRAQEALDAARALAARRGELAQRHAVLTEQLAAAARVDELADQVAAARQAQRDARRAHELARDSVELLTEHRLEDLRGELAGQLVSGDPCLVCGSCEHPAPASPRSLGVTDQQVRDAVVVRDQLHLEREAAELALARAEGRWQAAISAAADVSTSALAVELADVREQQAAAESAEEAMALLSEEVRRLTGRSAQLAATMLELSTALAVQQAAAVRLAEDLACAQREVDEARAGFPGVRDRIEHLEAQARAATLQASALARVAAAQGQRDRLAERACAQARAAGFDDAALAREALLPPEELGSLAEEVERWAAELDTLRAQAQAPELVEVASLERDAVAQAAAAAAEVVRIREQGAAVARREAAVAAQRRDRFTERRDEVRRAHAQRAELAARNDEIIALDQYARGMAGSPRMTLVTFVLRYWFEQVVAAANVRLAEMSAGKYQLVRVDESTRRDARVGLGLAVLDRHTGKERSPSTLSGGETFYTSLSLALGLADVVVAQAGGAQLDTLFIDEGFGSLDPDTLDDVMAVIDDLRGNGRVVGIVSHVPDLKERISERLSVRRTRPDGPSEIRVLA